MCFPKRLTALLLRWKWPSNSFCNKHKGCDPFKSMVGKATPENLVYCYKISHFKDYILFRTCLTQWRLKIRKIAREGNLTKNYWSSCSWVLSSGFMDPLSHIPVCHGSRAPGSFCYHCVMAVTLVSFWWQKLLWHDRATVTSFFAHKLIKKMGSISSHDSEVLQSFLSCP